MRRPFELAVVLIATVGGQACSGNSKSNGAAASGAAGGVAGEAGEGGTAGVSGGGSSAGGSGGSAGIGGSAGSGAGAAGGASAGSGGVGGTAGSGGSAGAAGSGGGGASGLPDLLSQTGLYSDIGTETVAADVRFFEPRFVLWTDTATKRRWIHLPPGTQIDTSDMSFWQFPDGTKLWKEFTRGTTRVETRLMEKRDGVWLKVAYLWNSDQSDAVALPFGQDDAANTPHDVPSANQCSTCHDRMRDRVLGFSAIQLDHASSQADEWTLQALIDGGLLTTAPAPGSLTLPGDATAQAALGYLHANCGHCHNPTSPLQTVAPLETWLTADALGSVAETPTYATTVGQLNRDETATLVVPASPMTSLVFQRMSVRAGGPKPAVHGQPHAAPRNRRRGHHRRGCRRSLDSVALTAVGRDRLRRVLTFRNEDESEPVHAMPLACRLVGGVVEDVAEMSIAATAAHLGADHAEALVPVNAQRAGFDLLKERRPATAAVKLVFGVVETLSAARAVVRPGPFFIEMTPGSRALGA